MQAVPQRQGIFYGWIIVATALVIIALGVGLMFSLGVFMEPLESALGWSREQIARANFYGWLAFGIFSFVFGMLSDRIGTRLVVLLGGVMLGVGMLVLSRVQALWHLYLFFAGGFGGFVLLACYFGLSFGGVMPLYPVVTREYFGARAMGASYGAIFLLSCVGMGLGAWLGGRIFDRTGAYTGLYVLSFLLSSTGAVGTLWLRASQAQRPVTIMPQTVRV